MYSCAKDTTSLIEDKNAVAKETKDWFYYSTNNKLDSMISKGSTSEKVYFFYKNNFIDSFIELIGYQNNKSEFHYRKNRSHKFIYIDEKLIQEKIGIYVYDYNLDTLYPYSKYPYDVHTYTHINDTFIEQQLFNNPNKGYLIFKNDNLVRSEDVNGISTYEYDNNINPLSNYLGLNKIYNNRLFLNTIQTGSINNVIKMNRYGKEFNLNIEYNSKLNPILIKDLKTIYEQYTY